MSYEIFNEDCLEGMKRIPDGSVDMIATDPPYCVGASSNGVKSSFSDFNLMRPFWEQCFNEWRRVLKETAGTFTVVPIGGRILSFIRLSSNICA